MPTVTNQIEYVTFETVDGLDAVPTGTPGWKGIDYTAWYLLGPKLGENRHRPGINGRLGVAKELDQLVIVQKMRINGRYDREGGRYTDQLDGVLANHLYLRENLFEYLGAARSVTLHARDGSTWVGTCTVEDWVCAPARTSGGDVLEGDLEVHVLGGKLTQSGS